MKVVYLGIILTFLLVAMSYAKPVHADSSDPVQILNVQVQPNIIKVNDTFLLDITILNNSTFPIYLTSGSCDPAFSVVSNTHAKQVYPNIACTAEAILQKVDPQSQVTISNANKPGVIYQVVQPGTATVNITLPYFVKNQTATDYSNIYYNTSKSFQFLIHDANETYAQKPPAYFAPPLQQIKAGVSAQNVKCGVNLSLVIKSKDNSPACVKKTSLERLVRHGWWVWNERVGNTIVNTSEKRDFDSKNCAMLETVSSIIGTNGFGRDDLPKDGITYPGENLTSLVGQVIQFSIKPNSEGYIIFTYDFNSYPGSNCKVTTKDVIAADNPSTPNISIAELLGSPDIMKVDENSVNTSIPPLGNAGDILLNLTSAENLNDHVVKVIYKIFAKPDAQLGKSYYIGFWYHSAVVITVGDSLYTGNAFVGSRYG
jgi:hypothetical protein